MTITTKKVIEKSIEVDDLLNVLEDIVSVNESKGKTVTTVDCKLLSDSATVIRELAKIAQDEKLRQDINSCFGNFLSRSYR